MDGLGPYNPKDYIALGLNEYRARFPLETSKLRDEEIWAVVSATEDDMSDDEWRALTMP
jgi:hypothetical protein